MTKTNTELRVWLGCLIGEVRHAHMKRQMKDGVRGAIQNIE